MLHSKVHIILNLSYNNQQGKHQDIINCDKLYCQGRLNSYYLIFLSKFYKLRHILHKYFKQLKTYDLGIFLNIKHYIKF